MRIIDALTNFQKKSSLPTFPNSFLFGVATADHQCEAYDPKFIDIRDVWEQARNPRAARRSATDFWNRYEEDVELAQKLGCNAFRFSISWSRIEPEPGIFNQLALDHYNDLIEKIVSCGMKPVMTLHHFTWPLHVERRGGMICDDFPDMFADYVTVVSNYLGRKVSYWITFNEPNLLFGGYFKPWWDTNYNAPPGLAPGTAPWQEVEAVGNLIRNLFLAHKKAYEIIKTQYPDAKVGLNQYCYGLPGWLQQLANNNAISIKVEGDLKKQTDKLTERRDLIRGARISKLRANLFDKDRVDVVIADLTITPERVDQVMFSQPYLVAGKQLIDQYYALAAAKGDRGLLDVLDSVVLELNESAKAMNCNADLQIAGERTCKPPMTIRALTISEPNNCPSKLQRKSVSGIVPQAPLGTTLRRIQDRGYIVVGVDQDPSGSRLRDPNSCDLACLEADLGKAIATRIFGNENCVRFRSVKAEDRLAALQPPFSFLDSILKPLGIISTMLAADWWYLGMAGKLDEFLCPRSCIGKLDFVGIDYYWGISSLRLDRISRLIDAAYRRFDQAPVWPGALYTILRNLQSMFPDKPLFIFENGSVESADNMDRATYIRKHLEEISRAMHDGVNVEGYIVWALTSNREWDCEFSAGNDFGLFHIELDRDPLLIRGPFTPAAITYQEIIRNQGS